MRTEEEIRNRIKWLETQLDEEENQNETMEVKIWAQLDALNWTLTERR